MENSISDDILRIELPAVINAYNADNYWTELDGIISKQPDKHIVFDADKLTYISSSGLRILMRVLKQRKEKIPIINVADMVYRVFEITGFIHLMDISKKMKEISIEGCEMIGAGRSSHVYRLDADTILKCYEPMVPIEMIKREQELSREAFVKGLPTAIPFDMVKVGNSIGVRFEMIKADTVGNFITSHPEEFDDVASKFTRLLRQIHTTDVDMGGNFQSVKKMWQDWQQGMEAYYTEDENNFLKEMIEKVPERTTMVHCDFHENNVLYQNGELVLIDLADIGYGHPIFDLAGMAFRAHASFIPGRKAHHGLSPENMMKFWKRELEIYFDSDNQTTTDEVYDMCRAFGYLRSALFPMKHKQISAELRDIHINDARQNLFSNREWALEQTEKLNKFFNNLNKPSQS